MGAPRWGQWWPSGPPACLAVLVAEPSMVLAPPPGPQCPSGECGGSVGSRLPPGGVPSAGQSQGHAPCPGSAPPWFPVPQFPPWCHGLRGTGARSGLLCCAWSPGRDLPCSTLTPVCAPAPSPSRPRSAADRSARFLPSQHNRGAARPQDRDTFQQPGLLPQGRSRPLPAPGLPARPAAPAPMPRLPGSRLLGPPTPLGDLLSLVCWSVKWEGGKWPAALSPRDSGRLRQGVASSEPRW